ncbi:S-layer homology domain-containing protein [Neglectibacter caecimuris]|uniref:S-layer homology domain-containing protein n=1 Tax=Neglectibacter caecimuris TaxID=3093658 RepID=UPI002AC987AD|nr:S-layer homology domain-containing protein [Neglectibacter sp. M00184]
MTKTASKQCGEAIKMNVRNGKKFLSLLLAVCLLVGCFPLSANAEEVTNIKEFWKEYVTSGKYQSATNVMWKDKIFEYAFLDIDGNGCEELLLSTQKDSLGFANYLVFEYDMKTETVRNIEIESQYEDGKYNLGDQYNKVLRYSPLHHALVYQELRNGMQMADWGYWTMKDKKLAISCRLAFDATGTKEPVYYFIENGKSTYLTETEYQAYIMEGTELIDFARIGELSGEAFRLQQEFYFQGKHIATINLPESWEGHVVTEKDTGPFPQYFTSISFYSRLNKENEYGGRLFTIQVTSGDDWKNMPRRTWLRNFRIGDIRYEVILWGPTDIRYDHDDPACSAEYQLMERGEKEVIDNIVFHIGTGNTEIFNDISASAYYYDAVAWAVENGITVGTDKTHFSPEQRCTRAQIVTFLWRDSGSPEPNSSLTIFSDVKAGEYYEKAVKWAVEQGVTNGTGKGKFSPEASCTRAQAVTFLWRAAGEPEPSKTVKSFSDVKKGSYYEKAVKWAVEQGITAGTGNGKFSPESGCTRAQIVSFLYRAYQ